MSPADSDSSLEFDHRDTDTERDIDFSMALWEVRKPLARREWKDRPEIYDQVRSLLGLDRFGDFWEAVRRFNPTKEELVELRRVIRSEASELMALVPHQYMYVCEPLGDSYREEAAHNRKQLEEMREDFELATNENTIPSKPPLVYSDRAHLVAFRELYTPWIGAFLFSLSARALFGKNASTDPSQIRSEFRTGKLTGNPPDDRRNYWDERYFSQCTWFCLLDTRSHRNEDSVLEQVSNRMERLWTLRPYAQRAGFTMNPGVARTDAAPNLPADVISAIVELGSPALDADRNRQDAIYEHLLEVLRSFPEDSEPRNLLSGVLRFSAPVERVFQRLKTNWNKRYETDPGRVMKFELCETAADAVFEELLSSIETTSFTRSLLTRGQSRAYEAIRKERGTTPDDGDRTTGTTRSWRRAKKDSQDRVLRPVRPRQYSSGQIRSALGPAEEALHQLDQDMARRRIVGALHGDRAIDRLIVRTELEVRDEGETPAKDIRGEVARRTGLDVGLVRRRWRRIEDLADANPEIKGILKQLGLEPKARRRRRKV